MIFWAFIFAFTIFICIFVAPTCTKDYEPGKELRLNVSEYKIDDKNPLFYQDMQKEWRLYLYFDKDGKIKFVPLTQEGLSEKKAR